MIRMLIVIKKGLLSLETLLRPRDYLPLRVGSNRNFGQKLHRRYSHFSLCMCLLCLFLPSLLQ